MYVQNLWVSLSVPMYQISSSENQYQCHIFQNLWIDRLQKIKWTYTTCEDFGKIWRKLYSVSFTLFGQLLYLSLVNTWNDPQKILHHFMGLLYDVISSKFCKSSYSHVGFLFAHDDIGKSNKIFHYFVFSSYHIIKLQPSDKNINTPTLGWNFKSFHEVNLKF